MVVTHFKDLIAWQLADELRREVLAFTETGPAARDFKYRDQIRDAMASACRNTSEGFDRFRPAEFARFLEFARGSLGETQDCLVDAHERKYITGELFDRLWLLSKRALGANTNLMKYLHKCVATGATPWRKKREPRTGNHEPGREPRTREP
jgi:four helix bundle protein